MKSTIKKIFSNVKDQKTPVPTRKRTITPEAMKIFADDKAAHIRKIKENIPNWAELQMETQREGMIIDQSW